jgi:DNA invertase Pin-like site-specific DNA recombinase
MAVKIGYMRVSTVGQNLDRQEDIMAKLGVDQLFSEKLSGKNTDRPQLQAMLDFVRVGDTLVVESISRLARSTRDLLNIVDVLNQKKVSFVSQKEAFDTSTPQGKFVLTIFAGLAELERENILQRQKEGIEAAKVRGANFGRPKLQKPDGFDVVAAKVESGEITATEAMQKLGLKKTSFYKLLKTKE